MLKSKIVQQENGLLFYSLTPPKVTTDPERIQDIAEKQVARLQGTPIDGLIVYDIQDESQRTDKERPFAFISTLSPEVYSKDYLGALPVPKIIYKSIANTSKEGFSNWLHSNTACEFAVFVGASSSQQTNHLSLSEAYALRRDHHPQLTLGGVVIPERHLKKGDEHLRIFNKIDSGCGFFVSQCVYSAINAKNLLSDYYYSSLEQERSLVPVIFTLAPCGSMKTLQFMEWLGIDVPKWLYNDLKNSTNILSQSFDTCKNIAIEIMEYAAAKKIPVGFNIESVSIKKEEIDQSIKLLQEIAGLLGR